MNKNTKSAISAGAGFAFVALILAPSVIRTRKNIKEIVAQGQADINAIAYAHGYVTAKMENGDYARKGIKPIMDDFKFYQIAYHNKK